MAGVGRRACDADDDSDVSCCVADSHCVWLASAGVPATLMTTLESHTGDVNLSLQHAVFSALKNLSIPGTNGTTFPLLTVKDHCY